MKRDLQSIFSFFTLSTLLLVLPGCISQKKLDKFRQQHADATVFEYVYRNKTYLGAVDVSFYATDQAIENKPSEQLRQDTVSIDLNDYQKPAISVAISPPVFLKKQHQGKIKLLLDEKNILASKAFELEIDANLSVVDGAEQVLFQLDIEQASKRETFKLNLDLIDETGEKLESEVLSFKRFFQLVLPKPERFIPEKCPEQIFIIHLSNEVEGELIGVQLRNDTLGGFITDFDGNIRIAICEDQLPVSYKFLIESVGFKTEETAIKFERGQNDIFIELEVRENSQSEVDVDYDEDGLVGEEDRCPNQAGPASNGGCPMDFDKDGLTGSDDRCPYMPGPPQNDGCPVITQPERGGETTEMPGDLIEDVLWDAIKDSDVPADFENFIEQFPDSKNIDQAQKKLQDSYTKIAKGLMSILIPDTMELNIPEIVTVMISGDTSLAARERVIDEFIDQQDLAPKDIPEVRDELIKITEIMRAELRDPSPPNDRNFFIDPPGEREQKVDLYGEDPTIWNWTVTPLKKGNHRLNVVVSIIFDQNGKEVPKVEEQLFTIQIIVQPTFWEKNLWWLITGLLLLGGLLWFLLFRKKEKQKELIKLQLPYQEIMGLIGAGEVKDALEKLETALSGVSDKYHQQVILYKSRFSENEENINLGVVDTQDATLEQTRITKGVLALMSKLKNEFEITS